MCLGVPGKVVELNFDDPEMPVGKVDFAGITKEIAFAFVPDVQLGDYVIVHAGFALNKIDEEEAMEVFQYLREMEELADLEG